MNDSSYYFYKKVFNNLYLSNYIFKIVKNNNENFNKNDWKLVNKENYTNNNEKSYRYQDIKISEILKNKNYNLFKDYIDFYFKIVINDPIRYWYGIINSIDQEDINEILNYKNIEINHFIQIYNGFQSFSKSNLLFYKSLKLGNFEITKFLLKKEQQEEKSGVPVVVFENLKIEFEKNIITNFEKGDLFDCGGCLNNFKLISNGYFENENQSNFKSATVKKQFTSLLKFQISQGYKSIYKYLIKQFNQFLDKLISCELITYSFLYEDHELANIIVDLDLITKFRIEFGFYYSWFISGEFKKNQKLDFTIFQIYNSNYPKIVYLPNAFSIQLKNFDYNYLKDKDSSTIEIVLNYLIIKFNYYPSSIQEYQYFKSLNADPIIGHRYETFKLKLFFSFISIELKDLNYLKWSYENQLINFPPKQIFETLSPSLSTDDFEILKFILQIITPLNEFFTLSTLCDYKINNFQSLKLILASFSKNINSQPLSGQNLLINSIDCSDFEIFKYLFNQFSNEEIKWKILEKTLDSNNFECFLLCWEKYFANNLNCLNDRMKFKLYYFKSKPNSKINYYLVETSFYQLQFSDLLKSNNKYLFKYYLSSINDNNNNNNHFGSSPQVGNFSSHYFQLIKNSNTNLLDILFEYNFKPSTIFSKGDYKSVKLIQYCIQENRPKKLIYLIENDSNFIIDKIDVIINESCIQKCSLFLNFILNYNNNSSSSSSSSNKEEENNNKSSLSSSSSLPQYSTNIKNSIYYKSILLLILFKTKQTSTTNKELENVCKFEIQDLIYKPTSKPTIDLLSKNNKSTIIENIKLLPAKEVQFLDSIGLDFNFFKQPPQEENEKEFYITNTFNL